MPKANQQLVLRAKVERPFWRVTVKMGDSWHTSAVVRRDEIGDHISRIANAGYADTIRLTAISEASYIKSRRGQ